MTETAFPYLTTQEAADELGLTVWAIQKLVQRGVLRGHYVGHEGARFRPVVIHRDDIRREKERRKKKGRTNG